MTGTHPTPDVARATRDPHPLAHSTPKTLTVQSGIEVETGRIARPLPIKAIWLSEKGTA